MIDLHLFFSSKGALAKLIDGYTPRATQLEMAQAVSMAIEQNQSLVAEAGTGTGKTFAYLVPAILSGAKVIISTGTKNLQDQLFNKDIAMIRQALSMPFKASLLKGRANYLCLYRLKNASHSHVGHSQQDATDIAKINFWSKRSCDGDVSQMIEVPETSQVWYQVTSTIDNCLGLNCPDYDDCYLVKARKKAREAEILVVNHHLLCADWSLRDTGFGELLPDADVIILDEAHQLADTASNFLGNNLGSKQLLDLADDILVEYFKDASDMPDLRTATENLQHSLKNLRMAFGIELKKGEWRELENNAKIMAGLDDLIEKLQALVEQLKLASIRTKGLENCYKRTEELEQSLNDILKDNGDQWIRWYETFKNSLILNRTPLNIANEFQSFMAQHDSTWIFTSATLSIAHKFDYFTDSLGITDARCHDWGSSFDYAQQSLFYHPRGVEQPASSNFVYSVVDYAVPVIEASQGRTFFLFTSHWALKQAAKLLHTRIDYPLFVQGERPKATLLDDFKNTPNAVLLGTSSFWEGVDVRGKALSCVIIDKLPFSAPSDPVLKARLNVMEKNGKNPFVEYQLPEAVITLRQGVGRLIRDVNDTGVLMICDPRLLKRSYGHTFLDSLPAMARTRDINDVRAFFQKQKT